MWKGFFLLCVGVIVLVIAAVDAKPKKERSMKCNKQIGRLKIEKTSGIFPDAQLGVKPLASYQTSNIKKCLVGCLFHKSHKCRAIALTRVGTSMACLLYAESYKEHPERFLKQAGTMYTEILCDYQELLTVVKLNETTAHRGIVYDSFKPDLLKKLQSKVRKAFPGIESKDDCLVKGLGEIKMHENVQWRVYKDKKTKQKVFVCQILSLSQ
ncbi:uncharacterized protein LOC135502363 [Lineus longissimus]|uniref:uncharacterized protein LOC135502363 n=1 Tax=Lineus longissimus TaxID=88925 RepID=UPI002B4EED8D